MISIDTIKIGADSIRKRMGAKKFQTVIAGVGACMCTGFVVLDYMIPDCPDVVETVAETITETIETEAV